jgi:hypothetical protein
MEIRLATEGMVTCAAKFADVASNRRRRRTGRYIGKNEDRNYCKWEYMKWFGLQSCQDREEVIVVTAGFDYSKGND